MSVIVINALTELVAAPAIKQFKRTWWELGGEGKKPHKKVHLQSVPFMCLKNHCEDWWGKEWRERKHTKSWKRENETKERRVWKKWLRGVKSSAIPHPVIMKACNRGMGGWRKGKEKG